MKRRIITASLIVMAVLISVFNIFYIIRNTFYDNIESLPQGEFLYSSMSPDGETTVSVYRVATPSGNAIRGAVVWLTADGGTNEKNIFWQLGADNVIVGWHDNKTVSINDKLIDITTENYYDSRYDFSVPA